MQTYKLRFLDNRNVAVLSRDFSGMDDLEALTAAELAAATHDIEVWQGEWRVARVKKGNAPLTEKDLQSL